MGTLVIVLGSMFAFLLAIFAIIFIAVPVFKGIGWMIGAFFKGIGWFFMHIFQFVGGTLTDIVRAVGAIIATIAFVPLVILNIIIGRWSASAHFGRAVKDEVTTFGHCLYRVAIGHPLRLLLLNGLVEGIEQRVPAAVAAAPGSDKPSKRTGAFDGYRIVGSLKTGGSGGKLYVAEPDETKLAAFARVGVQDVEQVVIKSFSLRDGSSMPQIVRESRALEAARKLGLVLEHDMGEERFYYVMRYVPGEDLTAVTKRLHTPTGNLGLTKESLREAMGYMADLLGTLNTFHSGGLWHKDVKPDNIIVHDGKAHLVDFGLITPLRSGMTLTTHGTEYFRDPELVRMALRGAKVHEVAGEKFDVYGAGAVLYSVIENSFPAHGGLSQITKRCPESLRWIVRRAMTDLNKRYPDANTMLADVRAVMNAPDPFALRPADLPSMRGESADGFIGYDEPEDEAASTPDATPRVAGAPEPEADPEPAFVRQAASPVPPREPERAQRVAPRLRVTDWISGRYIAVGEDVVETPAPKPHGAPYAARAAHAPRPNADRRARVVPADLRAPAHEQLKSARARAQAARERALSRRTPRHRAGKKRGRYSNEPNAGVVIAVLMFIIGIGVIGGGTVLGLAAFTPIFHEREQPLFAENASTIDFGNGKSLDIVTGDFGTLNGATRTVFSGGGRSYTVLADKDDSTLSQFKRRLDTVDGRPLLIISDFPEADPSDEFNTLVAIANALIADGYTVLGLTGAENDLEQLAHARAAIGLNQAEDDDTRAKLRDWLNSGETPVGAVLWATPKSDWPFVTAADGERVVADDDEELGAAEDCTPEWFPEQLGALTRSQNNDGSWNYSMNRFGVDVRVTH